MSDSSKPLPIVTGHHAAMNIDLRKASAFMATHARVLDRRRFGLLTGQGSAVGTLSALAAYRGDDGGYGLGLEPDLRAAGSQPVGALHAFEVFADVGAVTSPETTPDPNATRLCDWLASVTLEDGGLPFALPIDDATGCSPVWADADTTSSSLHMTAMVAGIAHRVGRHYPGVRNHPWLVRATGYSLRNIRALSRPSNAYEFSFVLQFLDAIDEFEPDARAELHRLITFLPESATMPVEGGIEGEAFHPLDFAPYPTGPLHDLVPAQAIAADLDRIAANQQHDGGWTIDFASASPAAALEWRGYMTVHAIQLLQAHRR